MNKFGEVRKLNEFNRKETKIQQVQEEDLTGPRRSFGKAKIKLGYRHIKGSKERYLLGQNTTCEFSG